MIEILQDLEDNSFLFYFHTHSDGLVISNIGIQYPHPRPQPLMSPGEGGETAVWFSKTLEGLRSGKLKSLLPFYGHLTYQKNIFTQQYATAILEGEVGV